MLDVVFVLVFVLVFVAAIADWTPVSFEKFFEEQLPVAIVVLTNNVEKVFAKEIASGELSKNSWIFNKKDAGSTVLWAETLYHDDLDYLKKRYKAYYAEKVISL